MKHSFIISTKIFILLVCIIFVSCQKQIDKPVPLTEEVATVSNQSHGHLVQTNRFAATVAQKWQDLQNRFLRTPTNANPFGRHGHRWFAYTGIALYEAVVPGMPAYQSLDDQLTDMPDMPETEPGRAYHWPTSANAAVAFMNKKFFYCCKCWRLKCCFNGFIGECPECRIPVPGKRTDVSAFKRVWPYRC